MEKKWINLDNWFAKTGIEKWNNPQENKEQNYVALDVNKNHTQFIQEKITKQIELLDALQIELKIEPKLFWKRWTSLHNVGAKTDLQK